MFSKPMPIDQVEEKLSDFSLKNHLGKKQNLFPPLRNMEWKKSVHCFISLYKYEDAKKQLTDNNFLFKLGFALAIKKHLIVP